LPAQEQQHLGTLSEDLAAVDVRVRGSVCGAMGSGRSGGVRQEVYGGMSVAVLSPYARTLLLVSPQA